MVLCIVALVVFGFLSLFSAKYRPMAKEAFRCVGRMITLRPCEASLEQRIKSKVTTKLMGVSAGLGGFVYKYFSAISWGFTISFFVSLAYTLYGVYNWIVFGNCDPGTPASSCAFNQGVSLFRQICDVLLSNEILAFAVLIGALAVTLFMVDRHYAKSDESE
jgi:hypothetical protein